MKQYRVSIVKKYIKYVNVIAKDEYHAGSQALGAVIGKDLGGCFTEYAVGAVVQVDDDKFEVDVMPS